MSMGTRQFWTEFIELYRSLPVLWNTRQSTYNDSSLKKEAYNVLASKLSEIESAVDAAIVKKRINALRLHYIKEFNRLKEMAKTASDEESIFISRLWYFNHFSFLDEFISTENSPEDETLHELIHKRCVIRARNSLLPPSIRPCITTASFDVMTNLQTDLENMSEDERTLANYFTSQYRELDLDQRTFVKEGIEEILRQARLGKLHRDSLKINEILD